MSFRAPALRGFACSSRVRRHWILGWIPEVRVTDEDGPVDVATIISDRQPRKILLEGFFQRYEHYRSSKDRIRKQWFALTPKFTVADTSLTIHIRASDIWARSNGRTPHPDYSALPFSYYRRIIEGNDWSAIHIVTDDPADLMAAKLARTYGAQVRSGETLEDFNFLRCSSNIVLSVSTFAWWAAWLSEARSIHFPLVGLLDPSHQTNVDLRVGDECRYEYHRPEVILPWTGTLADRRRLLTM